MSNIQAQLDQLFELEKQLNIFLNNEEYEQFQEQQVVFTNKIQALLDTHSQEDLISILKPLKQLQNKLAQLEERSADCSKQLKEKSLVLKRNKKIKAYK
ncbi:hypothetical protein ACLKMH_06780 [Psychromonas sp. KJ10-10]|uniref:hypothetical protein n=1 Tax=Psychromonas sp. KJ10-10 TaxID=3391823 RepID=UPI0039B4A835